jgi:hypothetical protein
VISTAPDAGVYGQYWRHKRAKEQAATLRRPVLRCFETAGLDETEALYFARCGQSTRILDVGAGDNRVKRKFVAAGYRGVYETVDVSTEFPHDYQRLEDVTGTYDGILLLDVIEHMPLEAFYALLARVQTLLRPGGVVVVSTPNPACIKSMWAGDITHIQQYPLNDLVAIFLMRGFSCEAYRVVYQQRERLNLLERGRGWLQKAIVTQLLGVDYADGLIVVATSCESGSTAAG